MSSTAPIDFKLEVVVIPVSDVDRAKAFYEGLGWRLDADLATGDDFRIIQVTPPGSPCSVIFGQNVSPSAPGSTQSVHLIVSDIEAARAQLVERGAPASPVFHCSTGFACRFQDGSPERADGPAPGRATYSSFVTFTDPDGNGWVLQEITTRLPGRVDPAQTTYASAADLSKALQRAAAAHGEHEKRTGQADAEWPAWYAEYMVREQSGEELPQ